MIAYSRVPSILRLSKGWGNACRAAGPPPRGLNRILHQNVLGKLAFCVVYCIISAILLPAAKSEDEFATNAEKGRALTSKELNAIYQDHTWPWADGAAFFRAANRGFIAWVGKDKKATYAEGTWSVNDQGRLCYVATWYGPWGHSNAKPSCFEHRSDDRNIYKRMLP